ncbi:S49 family peptidase [Comamonas testosteroni]|uniref:S49 family peptidase n=1 Tax=Comamonas testosteroni TaxID=285 RepID=UPI00265FBDEA|nr:S49 family peptidase [Comamonas testosteroni]WKL15670.1 S49 family peptidase [Comamonas testosteroni]
MNLRDLIQGAWALEPAMLNEIQAIYDTHLRGDKIDVAAVEARLGRPLANEQQEYEVNPDGVAVLQLSGVMAPKANLFARVSGGISTQVAARQVESAMVDQRVKGMVVVLNSPGGNVLGVPELAQTIFEAAASKPLVVFSDEQILSAGYWAASAANGIYISSNVVSIGSIGVVMDRSYEPGASKRQESVAAGKYKRMVNASEPLSQEARAEVQADVDYVYTLFVDDVARFRGASSEQVLQYMADGRVFRGQNAINAGLVDGVSTLDDLVARMAADPSQFAKRRKAVFALGNSSPGAGAAPKDPTLKREVKTMGDPNATPITRASLEQDHAPLFVQIRAEFLSLGATQERERIQAVLAVGDGLPGHTELLQGLAFDGKTTAEQAGMAVLTAEKNARAAAVAAHSEEAPKAQKPSAAPPDVEKSKDEQVAEAQAYVKENGGSLVAAFKALGYAQ